MAKITLHKSHVFQWLLSFLKPAKGNTLKYKRVFLHLAIVKFTEKYR